MHISRTERGTGQSAAVFTRVQGHRGSCGKGTRMSFAEQVDQVTNFQASTTFAARYALGAGVDRETVAAALESLAHAIRHPEDVAESMSPLTLDDLA